MLETDLKQIKMASKRKKRENYDFRLLLLSGGYKYSYKELAGISKNIEKQIDCTKCANCCKKTLAPSFTKRELKRIILFLGEDEERVFSRFKKTKDGDLEFKGNACPFLKNNLCAAYKVRPKVCRDYPYLSNRCWIIFQLWHSSVCPIIFNVLEKYKSVVFRKLEAKEK